jgi:membrane-bound lytic murein transglycosylase A
MVASCADIISSLPSHNISVSKTKKPFMSIFPITYNEIPGWKSDNLSETLPALKLSCSKIKKLPENKSLGKFIEMGKVSDWLPICKDAHLIRSGNKTEAQYFFESRFLPYTVANNQNRVGLFTGYYEAELNGAFGSNARYRYPILAKPKDIINANLIEFDHKLDGHRITGRIKGNKLVPYYTRAEIDDGALSGRQLETMWVDNAIDAFVLHIQGSGRIILPDGSYVRVGFDGRNGHQYTSVGRELVSAGKMRLKDVTMPSIRKWMEKNPVAARALMRKNKSFIFFKVSKEAGPIGAQGVILTPTRSIAIDREFFPMGLPVWLDTTVPGSRKKLQRLMITQDTGAAIKGPVRGDVFWGHGPQAAIHAGLMKEKGKLYLLLPRSAAKSQLKK